MVHPLIETHPDNFTEHERELHLARFISNTPQRRSNYYRKYPLRYLWHKRGSYHNPRKTIRDLMKDRYSNY